jgi:hypothetical protein
MNAIFVMNGSGKRLVNSMPSPSTVLPCDWTRFVSEWQIFAFEADAVTATPWIAIGCASGCKTKPQA